MKQANSRRPITVLWLKVGLSLASLPCFAQTDPGVQSANRGTGATIIIPANDPNGFTPFFQDCQKRFQDVESVSHSPTGNNGLGPRFNPISYVSCHAQPAIGGSGAATTPQFGFSGSSVAPKDTTPPLINANGRTREARFPFFFNPDGSVNFNAPNGGVEDLLTVTGSHSSFPITSCWFSGQYVPITLRVRQRGCDNARKQKN
jgi:hypothetical protein